MLLKLNTIARERLGSSIMLFHSSYGLSHSLAAMVAQAHRVAWCIRQRYILNFFSMSLWIVSPQKIYCTAIPFFPHYNTIK
jgi:hypothetical protein